MVNKINLVYNFCMKILIVCQYYYPENFVISKIAEKLVEYGHEVTVLTGKPNYGFDHILDEYKNVTSEVINGVNVERVNLIARKKTRSSIIFNYLSFWKNSKRWVRKCKKEFDIVYSMSLSPVTILAAGNLYKKKHNVNHVVHCVDLWPESVLVTNAVRKNSLFYKILYKWSKSLYSKADEILIGSPSFETYFRETLKLTNVPLKYVPQPSLVENSGSDSYAYDKDYFNVLYCGNLGRVQLIDMIPEAMKELKNEKIRFHIIGMGPKTDTLKEGIKKYGLENSVFYYGPIPAAKAATYFKGADALYISLKDEGVVGKTIPNKLQMSMAFAKPIIGMINGDGKQAILNADGGVICEQNPESLVRSLKAMKALSEAERKRLGINNLTYYQQNFSLSNISKIVEKELSKKAF